MRGLPSDLAVSRTSLRGLSRGFVGVLVLKPRFIFFVEIRSCDVAFFIGSLDRSLKTRFSRFNYTQVDQNDPDELIDDDEEHLLPL